MSDENKDDLKQDKYFYDFGDRAPEDEELPDEIKAFDDLVRMKKEKILHNREQMRKMQKLREHLNGKSQPERK